MSPSLSERAKAFHAGIEDRKKQGDSPAYDNPYDARELSPPVVGHSGLKAPATRQKLRHAAYRRGYQDEAEMQRTGIPNKPPRWLLEEHMRIQISEAIKKAKTTKKKDE